MQNTKKFETPEMTVVDLERVDIISTSDEAPVYEDAGPKSAPEIDMFV